MGKRKSVFFLSLGLLLPLLLGAQAAPDTDEAEVRQAMADQQAAWNRGDVEAFMQHYWQSDSLQFIGANGPTYGWQATLENYRRRYPDRTAMGQLTFDILTVNRRAPTVISLVGKFHLQRSIGDAEGYFLLIWQRIDDRWVIVADCTN